MRIRLGGILQSSFRFLASVLMVSGILLIADAGVTVAWQEPISAVLAERQQVELREALESPPLRVRAPTAERRPLPGDSIGRIVMPAIGKDYYLVEGTDADTLRRGPGHYPDTPLPGERGTVAIAGHRTTHGAPFRKIDGLRQGDRIILEMPYGTFVYRVERQRIVAPTDLWVKKRVGYNRLMLSACHPLYSAQQRIIVFARFVAREAARVRT